MKNNNTKRGYVPGDAKEFDPESQSLLLKAQKDIFYLGASVNCLAGLW